MNQFSTRYAPHIALMLALVLIPVAIHDYAGLRSDDCANPKVLIPASYAEQQPEVRKQFMATAFDADQWREGKLRNGGRPTPLSYATIRSWNAKRLYYRPAHRMAPTRTPSGENIHWVEHQGQEIPVHILEYGQRAQGGTRDFAAYLLMYESKPVSNPYWAQLLAAPLRLIRGGQPMTLFMVYGLVPTKHYEPAEKLGVEWLLKSFDQYQVVCSS